MMVDGLKSSQLVQKQRCKFNTDIKLYIDVENHNIILHQKMHNFIATDVSFTTTTTKNDILKKEYRLKPCCTSDTIRDLMVIIFQHLNSDDQNIEQL